jgi:hypothetical protein
MSKLFYHFKIYIDVANNYKNNTQIYFLLKNYAFKMVGATPNFQSQFDETEKKYFDHTLQEFQNEKANNLNIPLINADGYKAFLEEFFKPMDFESANLYLLNVCKDLTEVLQIYGPLEDLWNRRSNII